VIRLLTKRKGRRREEELSDKESTGADIRTGGAGIKDGMSVNEMDAEVPLLNRI
jgi:hypothetical protein